MKHSLRIAFAITTAVIAACAARVPVQEPHSSVPAPSLIPQSTNNCFWWHANFHVHWPENAPPHFAVDALLANEIFAPIIKSYGSSLTLWRFHRRALRDENGHVFSFIFYSTPQTAALVFGKVDHDPLLALLTNSTIIDDYHLDSTSSPSSPLIEGTSDKNWSLPLQRSWPYFIMGVSHMWLDLIAQSVAGDVSEIQMTSAHVGHADTLIKAYEKASDRINVMWHDQGQHAFLHHLSAIMGYGPIALSKDVQF